MKTFNYNKLDKDGFVPENSYVENNDIITETLAKVYAKQEHFEKAILAYQKLSLKYPQKSSYFTSCF